MNRSADRALVRAARDGDTRSIARLTTLFEDSRPETSDRRAEILNGLRAFGEPSVIVGFTGSPGAGKSSLIAALVPMLRAKSDVRIAVIAVDPSSTLSGGSLLGDRARMRGASERTFFRSQAAESTLGGLAASTFEVCRALEYLFDLIVLETVGVGQSESAVRALASRLYLVMQPSTGDRIQHLKAGLFEVPDVFVMNKSDLDGASASSAALQASLRIATQRRPLVLETSAADGSGLDRLCSDVLSAAHERGPGCVAVEPAFFRAWVEHQFGRAGLESLDSRPGFMETAGGYDAGKRSFGIDLLTGSSR